MPDAHILYASCAAGLFHLDSHVRRLVSAARLVHSVVPPLHSKVVVLHHIRTAPNALLHGGLAIHTGLQAARRKLVHRAVRASPAWHEDALIHAGDPQDASG